MAFLLGGPVQVQATPGREATIALAGAGSSFDAPLFKAAFAAYHAQNPQITISYDPIGSGGGIQKFIANQVDFGATDVPLNQLEQSLAETSGGPVVQIPIALGGVAIAYNDPKIRSSAPLRLDGATLAAIFLGKITHWNDSALVALNPQASLPADQIRAVHRADSSGTTYMFTDYLSSVSPYWANTVGKGKAVAWPGGYQGKGSGGVSGWVRRHQGSIGYFESKYAVDNKLTYAQVKNRVGAFVSPTLTSVRSAAEQFPRVSPTAFSVVNAPGANSYPIVSYSWVLLRQKQRDPIKGAALVKLFSYLSTEAQQRFASSLNYVPLPPATQQLATADLSSITGGGHNQRRLPGVG